MLLSLIFWLLAITIAITIHEFSHAYMADKLGDPTARLNDRLSLNPIAHYDPIGTTLLIITAVVGPIPFGWAKPVPFDPFNLENPKRDSMLIALAGPASNLLLAVVVGLLLRFITLPPLLFQVAAATVTLNIALAIFNLIPIHPLDGGKILAGILPDDLADEFNLIMRQYGFIIILFLIFPTVGGRSPISLLISQPIILLRNLLLP